MKITLAPSCASLLRPVVRGVALVLLGLFAGGVFFIVIAPSLAKLPGDAYVRYWQALNTDYGRAMPPFLLTCMGLIGVAGILSRGRGRATLSLTLVALLLIVLAVLVTVTQLDSLNRLADTWNPDRLPPDWANARQIWLNWHSVRTALAVLAFVSLLTAQTVDGHRRPGTVQQAFADR